MLFWFQIEEKGGAAAEGFDISVIFGDEVLYLLDLARLAAWPFDDWIHTTASIFRHYIT